LKKEPTAMLDRLKTIPPDPILGIISAHLNDPNPNKIDLGVGVYKDDHGHTPILKCVKQAEQRRIDVEDSKTYLGPPGVPGYNSAITQMIFGEECEAVEQGRVRTIQTPGGTGALRVAADLIRRANPDACIRVTDPTWANHLALFPAAGLRLDAFPYFDKERSALRSEEMLAALSQYGPGDVVVLHACCHNPCGVDLSTEDWKKTVEIARERRFIPLIDIAYQGFGTSIEEDAQGIRMMAEAVPEMIVASSCSKNFGLYRERTGAVSIMTPTADQATATESVIHNVTRGLYSMPPAHGTAIVDIILHDQDLTAMWLDELAEMRERIAGLRRLVVEKIKAKGIQHDFGFIERQRGMFSFLGIDVEQVHRLRDEYSVYMVDSARINIAGFSRDNVDYFVEGLASVL
jgi:aspartate aminotransferase